MDRKIIFHLTLDGLLNWTTAPRFELYRRVYEVAASRSIDVTVVRSNSTMVEESYRSQGHSLHFAHGASVQGRGWLNSSLAYIPGFWHVNPIGVLANSPAKDLKFNSNDVNEGPARRFLSNLQAKFSSRRVSRYRQERGVTSLPPGCIGIFLQGKHPYWHKQNYLSMEMMIREVLANTSSRAVVIKPHPLERDFGIEVLRKLKDEGADFTITNANVHDVLEASSVVVSVNSSVTFEGFMHGKPAIVFGRTDHTDLVQTVQYQGQFKSALDAALFTDWHYGKMLYWYFKTNTVEVLSRKFGSRLYKEILASGVEPERFGICFVGQSWKIRRLKCVPRQK